MIFISVGNNQQPFIRLLKNLKKYIKSYLKKPKVICQIGYTDYSNRNLKLLNLPKKIV